MWSRFRGSSNAADKKDASAGFHPGSGSKPVDAGNFSSDKKGKHHLSLQIYSDTFYFRVQINQSA